MTITDDFEELFKQRGRTAKAATLRERLCAHDPYDILMAATQAFRARGNGDRMVLAGSLLKQIGNGSFRALEKFVRLKHPESVYLTSLALSQDMFDDTQRRTLHRLLAAIGDPDIACQIAYAPEARPSKAKKPSSEIVLSASEVRSVATWLADRIGELRVDEDILREEDPHLLPGLRKMERMLATH